MLIPTQQSIKIPGKRARASGPDQIPPRGLRSFVGCSLQTDLCGLVLRSEHAMESNMMDTGHVGAASNDMAEVTQGIAAIVSCAHAARNFLDHRPPDLDEVRQALDCIVR